MGETKALFASLRTNLQAWSDANKDGGGLRSSLDAMKADFETAVAPLDQSLADWVVVSGRGIKLFNDYTQGKSTAITVNDGSAASALGSCTLYKDAAATIAMTAGDVPSVTPRSVACALNGKIVEGSERGTGSFGQYTRSVIARSITLLPVASGNFSYTAQTQRASQDYLKDQQGLAYSIRTLGGPVAVGSAASGSITYTMTGNAVTTALIVGTMPARTDASGVALTDYETWRINTATTAEANNINKYAFSGYVDAIKNGATLGNVKISDGSFVRVADNGGRYRVTEGKLGIEVATASSKVSGTLSLSKFDTDKYGNRYLPNYAQFSGSFTNNRAENFNGVITAEVLNYKAYDSSAPQSATNFATGSAAFKGSLKIASRPLLAVTFAARATGYKTSEFNATYNDGANAISFDGNNSLPRTVHIGSATGVTVNVVDGDKYYGVFKNNGRTALINTSTKMINYADGSFESIY